MMKTLKRKVLFFTLLSLLSVVRGYNILILIAAQYLAAIFVFSPKKSLKLVILDVDLFFLVIATVGAVAGGYIINNFYDAKTDKINRPIRSNIDSYLKQEIRLYLYFTLNFISFLFGWFVSWRAAIFFGIYIFIIWFYSHKLKKYALFGLISATVLTLLPFFVIFVHFKNFSAIIFVHACFLFLVIMVREIIKGLENIKGDIANNYNSFPVSYGEATSKKVIILLLTLTLIPITILFNYPAITYMRYYFYFAAFILVFIGFYAYKAENIKQYSLLHNILKVLLLIGVFSLLFIDKSLIVDRVF